MLTVTAKLSAQKKGPAFRVTFTSHYCDCRIGGRYSSGARLQIQSLICKVYIFSSDAPETNLCNLTTQ